MEAEDYVEKLPEDTGNICLIDIKSDEIARITEDHSELQFFTNVQVDFVQDNLETISINDIFPSIEERTRFLLSVAIEEDYISPDEDVAVILKSEKLSSIVFSIVKAGECSVKSEMRELFFESKPDAVTVQNALEIATSLARTGQKGEPVGALFVLGDEDEVLNRSRPLNYNPFGSSDVHIGDDVVSASIGEYAKLDGAFIISDAGRIISANRYLEPKVRDAQVPSGLGARHMAASGITKSTKSVAIVVSESDQKIRCFVDGEIVMTSDAVDVSTYV